MRTVLSLREALLERALLRPLVSELPFKVTFQLRLSFLDFRPTLRLWIASACFSRNSSSTIHLLL